MESLLARLERRFGRYAPQNLTLYLVGLMGVTWLLNQLRPGFAALLTLDPSQVLRGQLWRLVTFVLIPPADSALWLFFALWWTWALGQMVEQLMGSFRYALFWLVGIVATALAAFAFGVPATNRFLLMSLFLAFATQQPDYEILLFFVLPVRVKWLALLDVALLALLIVTGDGWQRLLPLAAISNYLLFFGPTLVALLRGRAAVAARPAAQKRFAAVVEAPRVRRCALCGVTDEDRRVEFRVCTCAHCGGKPTDFCLAHARNHAPTAPAPSPASDESPPAA